MAPLNETNESIALWNFNVDKMIRKSEIQDNLNTKYRQGIVTAFESKIFLVNSTFSEYARL